MGNDAVMQYNGISLYKTCECSPEQYDALRHGVRVGYLRVRYGYFTVFCPDANGDVVLNMEIDGVGCFADAERDYCLSAALYTIDRWVKCNVYDTY